MNRFLSDNVSTRERGYIALDLIIRSSRVSRASLGGGVSLLYFPDQICPYVIPGVRKKH